MSRDIRPGARGGRDQFSWEQVKEDKQRLNYLGSSIHGLPDKFKKDAETYWYAKDTKTIPGNTKINEINEIKDKEKQVMDAMLGISSSSKIRKKHTGIVREHNDARLSNQSIPAQSPLASHPRHSNEIKSYRDDSYREDTRHQARNYREYSPHRESRTRSRSPRVGLSYSRPYRDNRSDSSSRTIRNERDQSDRRCLSPKRYRDEPREYRRDQ